jgi:hypothetical protein
MLAKNKHDASGAVVSYGNWRLEPSDRKALLALFSPMMAKQP